MIPPNPRDRRSPHSNSAGKPGGRGYFRRDGVSVTLAGVSHGSTTLIPPRRARSRRRLIGLLVLGIVCLAGIQLYFLRPLSRGVGGPSGLAGVRERAAYQPLSGQDQERLDRQRKLVSELARRHVGLGLTGSSQSDLRVIQRILDLGVLGAKQTFELQALGVALGDVMAAKLGLHWVVFQDDVGRSRALRLGDTDVVLFPVTMISKRVEAGIKVSVDELWRNAARTVAEARQKNQRAGRIERGPGTRAEPKATRPPAA